MNDTKSQAIIAIFAFVPYALVSWGYVSLTDGTANDFWLALGVLLAVRLFFSVIEILGSVLSWRLYGKRLMVQKYLAVLHGNNFPKRKYAHDDFTNYLARIEDDPDCSPQLRTTAKEWYRVLALFEEIGILLGMRMHAAAEEALDMYSPKSEAQVYGASTA